MKEAKEVKDKPDWDASTTATKNKASAEDRMASKIAAEVLKENAKLRGVHSKESIKAILEKEAKRQMQLANGGEYAEPIVSRIVEKDIINRADPSNLPYLHKNPAV